MNSTEHKIFNALRAIIQGYNPFTGELLDDESILKNDSLIAHFTRSINLMKKLDGVSKGEIPSRSGERWSDGEINVLINAFSTGVPIDELAHRHLRSMTAVVQKIVSCGLLDSEIPDLQQFIHSNNLYRTGRIWSDVELSILSCLMGSDIAIKKISLSLRRDEQEIINVAKRDGYGEIDCIAESSISDYESLDLSIIELQKYQPQLAHILELYNKMTYKEIMYKPDSMVQIKFTTNRLLAEENYFTSGYSDRYDGIAYYFDFLIDMSCVLSSGDELYKIYLHCTRFINNNCVSVYYSTKSKYISSVLKLLYGAMVKGNKDAEKKFEAALKEPNIKDCEELGEYYYNGDDNNGEIFINEEEREDNRRHELYQKIRKHLEDKGIDLTKLDNIKYSPGRVIYTLEEDLTYFTKHKLYTAFRDFEVFDYHLHELMNNLRLIKLKIKKMEREEDEESEAFRLVTLNQVREFYKDNPDVEVDESKMGLFKAFFW